MHEPDQEKTGNGNGHLHRHWPLNGLPPEIALIGIFLIARSGYHLFEGTAYFASAGIGSLETFVFTTYLLILLYHTSLVVAGVALLRRAAWARLLAVSLLAVAFFLLSLTVVINLVLAVSASWMGTTADDCAGALPTGLIALLRVLLYGVMIRLLITPRAVNAFMPPHEQAT